MGRIVVLRYAKALFSIAEEKGKYATQFIILHNQDKQAMEATFTPHVKVIADGFASAGIGPYGHILLPVILRDKIKKANLDAGPYPPRQDGGHGWFLVSEEDGTDTTFSGLNMFGNNQGILHYFHIKNYFHPAISPQANRLMAHPGPLSLANFSPEDIAPLIQANLVAKTDDGFAFTFPQWTHDEFYTRKHALEAMLPLEMDLHIQQLVKDISQSFHAFTPKRLNSQINQWVNCYVSKLVGLVTDVLVGDQVLEAPIPATAFTKGVVYLTREYMNS